VLFCVLLFHSCIFMSCNFMSCTLVRQFHVLQFHALQNSPSISRPLFSIGALKRSIVSDDDGNCCCSVLDRFVSKYVWDGYALAISNYVKGLPVAAARTWCKISAAHTPTTSQHCVTVSWCVARKSVNSRGECSPLAGSHKITRSSRRKLVALGTTNQQQRKPLATDGIVNRCRAGAAAQVRGQQ